VAMEGNAYKPMNLKQALRAYYRASIRNLYLMGIADRIESELQKHMPDGVFILDDPSTVSSDRWCWVWICNAWRWESIDALHRGDVDEHS
jgi:hypothetical protein